MPDFHRIGHDITPELNHDLALCAGRVLSWEPVGEGIRVLYEAGLPRGGFQAADTGDLAVFASHSAADGLEPTGQAFSVTFSFPRHGVLRVEVGSGNRYPYVVPNGPPPAFSVREDDGGLHLEAGGFHLAIDRERHLFTLWNPEGDVVVSQAAAKSIYWGYHAHPLCQVRRRNGIATAIALARRAGESYYGFGEQFTDLDRRNQAVDIWNVDPANTLGNGSYANIPLYLSTDGYGLLLDSPRRSRFDMGTTTSAAVMAETEGEALDLYVLAGTMKTALNTYFDLTGRPSPTPPWSYGLWMSSLPTYTSARGVLEAAEEFRRRGFPCDLLHVDPVWMGQKSLVCDFEWGPAFPDPDGFVRRLRALGFKLSLWVSPYVPVGSPLHEEGLERDCFVRDAEGRVLVNEGAMNFWSVPFSYVDFSSPGAAEWYKDRIRCLAAGGADVIKNDLGELGPAEALYRDGLDGPGGHNRYCQDYARATWEACREVLGEDAMIWSRSGFIGAATTPCHWAGDVSADFENMRGQLRAVLGAGLGGFVFFSHDTGGFTGTPTPELYARWFQMGCFTSHMRAHGCFPHEPWHYGDRVYGICLAFARLRYALLPTLYSASICCCQEGRPMASALVLEYQDDLSVRGIDDQYLFADSLLVCPVFGGDTRRSVYLPEGTWFDFHTGDILQGGRRLSVETPLERIPLYVRDDTILFLCDERAFTPKGEADWGRIRARIYTTRERGTLSRQLYQSRDRFREIRVEIDGGVCRCDDPGVECERAAGWPWGEDRHGSGG